MPKRPPAVTTSPTLTRWIEHIHERLTVLEITPYLFCGRADLHGMGRGSVRAILEGRSDNPQAVRFAAISLAAGMTPTELGTWLAEWARETIATGSAAAK